MTHNEKTNHTIPGVHKISKLHVFHIICHVISSILKDVTAILGDIFDILQLEIPVLQIREGSQVKNLRKLAT